MSVTIMAGRRRIASSRGHQTLQRSLDAARPIQLPPLSSPEDRPRREVSGTKTANLRRMYPPRGGSPRRIKPFYRPLSTRALPPNTLADASVTNNPQTRNGAYRRKTIGLQFPSSSPGAADAKPTACYYRP